MISEHIIAIALVALVHSGLIALFPRLIVILRRAWRSRGRDR